VVLLADRVGLDVSERQRRVTLTLLDHLHLLAVEDDGDDASQIQRAGLVAVARNAGNFLSQGGQPLLGSDFLPRQPLHRVLIFALFSLQRLDKTQIRAKVQNTRK
jgi:hypothetical protein